MDVEALAVALAWEDTWDHVMGDFWFGYPNSENDDEMQAAMESRLPSARDRATQYVAILIGAPDDRS